MREKLNDNTREKWEESVGSSSLPTLKDFIAFLERRSLIENSQSQPPSNNLNKNRQLKDKFNSRSHFKSAQSCLATSIDSRSENSKSICSLCKGPHIIYTCGQFLNMNPLERYDFVKKTSLCHNCLLSDHRTLDCRQGNCRKCHKRHSTLLHLNKVSTEKPRGNEQTQLPSTSNSTTTLVSLQTQVQTQVVLGTAVVDILDGNGHYRPCRALLDSCSQCNSITEQFVNTLGLSKKEVDIKLKGVENIQSRIKYITSTKIKSRYDDIDLRLSFLVFKEISESMPAIPIDKNQFRIPEDIFLADSNFHKPSNIDILIGAEHFYTLLRTGQIRLKGQSAIFQETDLGWIFAGRYISPQIPEPQATSQIVCNVVNFQDLPILWELREENSQKILSSEEQAAESHYRNNTKRLNDGHYCVNLPFNDKKSLIGHSRSTAFQRFYALERKFESKLDLKSQYPDCNQNYLDQGHTSLINDQDIDKPGYYLPHHAVIKKDSLTTKLRVVFDGSAKFSTGVSLNDLFLVGPTIQDDLFTIVTRFRSFPYALTADIEQMYRQVRVHPSDSLYQRILWRENSNVPIKIYSLNTVTFGTSCAPYLAIRTLHQLADDEQESFPLASRVLKRDFYVDDVLTGAFTFEDAVELKNDLNLILAKGGFNLQKWASNCSELLGEFPVESSDKFMSLDLSGTIKALGLHWDPNSDSFLYTVNLIKIDSPPTKRSILSQCAKLFDPLGLLGPVIVIGKILMQQLWKIQLEWDDPVPAEFERIWLEYKKQLPLLNQFRYQRCITLAHGIEFQLHGFCDASEKAYGACLYLRSTDLQGRHHCTLISSKSRVAPIKTITLSKLELCSATLLVQLYNATVRSFDFPISKTIFWSDSTITLNWINTPPHTLTTFVANLVAEIQATTKSQSWLHVRTHENPADYISRGQDPNNFLSNLLWRNGPQWLSENENVWPKLDFKMQDIPEKRIEQPVISFKITQESHDILSKYSDIKTLQRVVAYIFRFIHNLKLKDKNSRAQGQLSQDELTAALNIVIKMTQAEAFSSELIDLSRKQNVNSKSSLFRLNPFLDQGIIKVGGRLINASIPESQKHPVVLPKSHHVTKLIIRDVHVSRFHAGPSATLYGVREYFWPIDGRNMVRHIIRQCMRCFRAKPREANYIMGNLPKARTSFSRPFLQVGVDYCSPFFTKEHRHRNQTKIKTYVSVFVCFATKAVHLELANDLTSEAFLACLKRFFARRGLANTMHSDNAKNFVGTNKELQELSLYLESIARSKTIQGYLQKKGVTWRLIPPRVAGNTLLTYEQLHTYVVEVEAILNSRALTPLSSDPNDLLPGHFLIGSSMKSLPQDDLRNLPAHRLSCWQLAQQMRHHFWERWHKEYLNEMISRNKWQSVTNQSNITPGTLVVVKKDNLPPMKWSLARIVQTHPGQDGVIRTVTIRSTSGTYKRALKHLYPLPLEE